MIYQDSFKTKEIVSTLKRKQSDGSASQTLPSEKGLVTVIVEDRLSNKCFSPETSTERARTRPGSWSECAGGGAPPVGGGPGCLTGPASLDRLLGSYRITLYLRLTETLEGI